MIILKVENFVIFGVCVCVCVCLPSCSIQGLSYIRVFLSPYLYLSVCFPISLNLNLEDVCVRVCVLYSINIHVAKYGSLYCVDAYIKN